uniref:ST8 alpha-N-acetyl-neuraminide alpha-2,8-sialyltransferase 6 n=1 Tax=Pelusios castaneus TaxID=367368 RepID=A0A8C8RFJ3_9SAUR
MLCLGHPWLCHLYQAVSASASLQCQGTPILPAAPSGHLSVTFVDTENGTEKSTCASWALCQFPDTGSESTTKRSSPKGKWKKNKNTKLHSCFFCCSFQSPSFLGYPFKHCAVVGNGGILKNSSCGAEIDNSDFVFRCNLPPTTGSISKDVGKKTNLVTVNPSIIAQKYNKLNERKVTFLENIASYGNSFLLLPAFSFKSNTAASFKVYHTLQEFSAKQRAIFFHPRYLKSLAQFWRTKGVKAYRLSSGFMIASAAVELCENVKLYGFWPFSKTTEEIPISHHYYDNQLPKPGFHAMPKEYNQILQLHGKGILKVQFGKCDSD